MNDPDIVAESSRVAQSMIMELYANNPQHKTFDQVGLLDGEEIVSDYLSHGELVVALSHLLYMIHEADIPFPRKRMLLLHEIAERIGEQNHYSKKNQANLSPEQLSAIYNAP